MTYIQPIFHKKEATRFISQFGLLFGTLCKQSYRSWLQTQNCSCWLFTSPSFDVCRILVNGDAINGLLLSGRDQQFSQRDSGPLRLWTTGIPCRTLLCCEVVQWLDDVNGRGSSTVCINEFVLLLKMFQLGQTSEPSTYKISCSVARWRGRENSRSWCTWWISYNYIKLFP